MSLSKNSDKIKLDFSSMALNYKFIKLITNIKFSQPKDIILADRVYHQRLRFLLSFCSIKHIT